MTVIINGSNGITSVNGTAAAPSVTGTDTDTGIVYGTNTVTIATNGTAGLIQDASQNIGVSGTTPNAWTSTYKVIQSLRAAFMGLANRAYMATNWVDDGGGDKYINADYASRYIQLSGIHRFDSAPSGTAGGALTFTTVLTAEKDKSVALQGASSSTGTGISFPATQSASTDANTLDDYEEGTFTPVLTADSGSGWTYSTQVGAYTKIGNVVHVAYVLGLSSKGTMSGSFYLSGLPFTVENIYSSAEPWGIAFSLVNGLSTSVVSLTGWANNASTVMQVRKQTAAATGWGNSYLDVVDIGTSFYIQCSCTYRT